MFKWISKDASEAAEYSTFVFVSIFLQLFEQRPKKDFSILN